MAKDRPDLDVAACTLAKPMAHPKSGDEWLVKRVCRYIEGRPRYALTNEYQSRRGPGVGGADMRQDLIGGKSLVAVKLHPDHVILD